MKKIFIIKTAFVFLLLSRMPILYAGDISFSPEKSYAALCKSLLNSDTEEESFSSFFDTYNPFSGDPFQDSFSEVPTYSTASSAYVDSLNQQRNDLPSAADADKSSPGNDTFIESILNCDISSFLDTNNSSHEIIMNNQLNQTSCYPDTAPSAQAVQPAAPQFFGNMIIYNNQHAASDNGDALTALENRCIFDTEPYSILHVKSVGSLPKKIYKCNHPFCKFETIYYASINDHLNTHSERAKTCNQVGCPYKSTDNKAFRAHMREHHPEASLYLVCDHPYCIFKTLYLRDLTKHVEAHGEKAISCQKPDCSFKSTSARARLNHMQHFHSELVTTFQTVSKRRRTHHS